MRRVAGAGASEEAPCVEPVVGPPFPEGNNTNHGFPRAPANRRGRWLHLTLWWIPAHGLAAAPQGGELPA
eukprot:4620167-Lingulodinium_polyedra.AAC.1